MDKFYMAIIALLIWTACFAIFEVSMIMTGARVWLHVPAALIQIGCFMWTVRVGKKHLATRQR